MICELDYQSYINYIIAKKIFLKKQNEKQAKYVMENKFWKCWFKKRL